MAGCACRHLAVSLDPFLKDGRHSLPYSASTIACLRWGLFSKANGDDVLAVVKQSYEAMRTDCPRISCSIKIGA